MNRKIRVTVAVMLIVTAFIVPGIAGTQNADFARDAGLEVRAVSSSCNCEVYNTRPASMTLKKGKSESIKKVYRYAFKIRNAETFSSLKNVIKGLNGKTFKATSFKWVSADEKIARVNSKGKVTGVRKGTTYIYPIRNTVCSYKTKKTFVLYTDINLLDGLKVSGAFAMKVTVR